MPPITQRRITLLRHAKAVAESEAMDDHARPLAPRGRDDAMALGAWMQENHTLPELVICSTATRTRETLAALGVTIPTILAPRVYLASAGELFSLLQDTDDAIQHVMLIGHNPGMHGLASSLASSFVREADEEQMVAKFPTCGFVSMGVALAHWKKLAPQSTVLDVLRYPGSND
jgi:phosphohistidine phosphatase